MPEVKTNTVMSVKDLLKRRFKLIADYPGNSQPIGNITIEDATASYFMKFPANFKELKWYAEREVSQMPKYLKLTTSRPVSFEVVKNWTLDDEGNWGVSFRGHSHCLNMWAVEPATLEDYQTFK